MNFPAVFLTLLFLHVLDILTQTHSAPAAVHFSCKALKFDGNKRCTLVSICMRKPLCFKMILKTVTLHSV